MKWHVSWRHLVWRSDSLHTGTFVVHPFFSPSSSPSPPPPSLNWMFCCYNPFHYLKLLKMTVPSFSGLSFFSVLSGIIRIYQYIKRSIYQYINMSILAVHSLICSLHVVSISALFTTLLPVCSPCDISIIFVFRFRRFRKIAKSDY